VLWLLVAGMGNKEIAQQLGIAEQTVKHHASGIYHRMGVEGRVEAVVKAIKTGMVRVG